MKLKAVWVLLSLLLVTSLTLPTPTAFAED